MGTKGMRSRVFSLHNGSPNRYRLETGQSVEVLHAQFRFVARVAMFH